MHVTRINVTPIKGTALHHPENARIERTGVVGNRRFFVLENETNRYRSSRLRPLLRVRADYDLRRDRLVLRLPGGRKIDGPAGATGSPERVDLWGRTVPARSVGKPFDEALTEVLGRPVRLMRVVNEGDGNDDQPVTLVSRASVAELAPQAGRAAEDHAGRFRMTLEIDGVTAREEDGWRGKSIRVGEVLLKIGNPVPRCAVTTWNPTTGERDLNTLKLIERVRGRTPFGLCLGVYATVLEPGTVRRGDPVEIEGKPTIS